MQNKLMYPIVETFVSINGEGRNAGCLALFIRFKGCNLNCSYCDTKWANEPSTPYCEHTLEELVDKVQTSNVKFVTVTGGEPLIQPFIFEFLNKLSEIEDLTVEVETNGSVDIMPFKEVSGKIPHFTVDYKGPSSLENHKMCLENLKHLGSNDILKCVVADEADLMEVVRIREKYAIKNIYLSPMFGKIHPQSIVEFMKNNHMFDVKLQMQLHKLIWHPNERGV